MTTFAAAEPRRRGLALTIAVLILTGLALVLAVPAGAVVSEVNGTTVGLQPRTNARALEFGTPFNNENGNAVVHGSNVLAIYWDPGHTYHHEWVTNIDTFLQQMGGDSGKMSNIFADLAQYRDRTNLPAAYHTVYRAAYSDTAKFPAAGCTDPKPLAEGEETCLTDAQLRAQLQSFIAARGLPTGMNTIYFVMTPPGVAVCVDSEATSCSHYSVSKVEEEKEERNSVSYKDSFCSYHSFINPDAAPEGDGNTILYAAIPWSAGTLPWFGGGMSGFVAKARVYANEFDCQDGGNDPSGPKGEHPEKRKEETEKEKEEFENKTLEEKEEALKTKLLEGGHVQEPNQELNTASEEGDYSDGASDLIINQIAEEQTNIVTDPLLDGWQNSGGGEVSDECRNDFIGTADREKVQGSSVAVPETEAGTLSNTSLGTGRYYLNNTFSRSGDACVGAPGLVARFTSPNAVNNNEIVGFDGMESTVSMITAESFGPSGPPTPTYATFKWNFGDGSPELTGFAPGAPFCETPWLTPCAASEFHSYTYGGTYTVTLTITDVAGNTTSVSHEVTVNGPPAPGSPGSGAGSSPKGKEAIVTPLVAASILSRSLKKALKHGLVIRYSVNEKVTGHFEILLAKSLAKRLHVGGATATNLPPGTAPQVVIAKAILVTTKGGRSTITIRFSKKTASHLKRLHSASLMLRLIVRNAASNTPQTAVVLTKQSLSG